MRKRMMALVLSGILSMAVLAGCGNSQGASQGAAKGSAAGGTQENAKSAGEQAADTGASGAGESETLTVWCWDPEYNIKALEIAESIYREEHPQFRLEIIETNQEDIYTKMATATTSGVYDVLPDILLFDDSGFQSRVESFPEVFTDLTEYGFNYEEFSPGKV